MDPNSTNSANQNPNIPPAPAADAPQPPSGQPLDTQAASGLSESGAFGPSGWSQQPSAVNPAGMPDPSLGVQSPPSAASFGQSAPDLSAPAAPTFSATSESAASPSPFTSGSDLSQPSVPSASPTWPQQPPEPASPQTATVPNAAFGSFGTPTDQEPVPTFTTEPSAAPVGGASGQSSSAFGNAPGDASGTIPQPGALATPEMSAFPQPQDAGLDNGHPEAGLNETTPTDLSSLANASQEVVTGSTPMTPATADSPTANAQVMAADASQAVTSNGSGGFPKWVLIVGALIILLLVGAGSAFFILGIGKPTAPATQAPAVVPPLNTAPKTLIPQPVTPTASPSANFGNLQAVTPPPTPASSSPSAQTGTSAIQILQQRAGK